MTPCSTSSTWKTMTRSGAIAVVFSLGLASTGISYAADGSASTVRALIGGDGKVTSVSRLGGDSAAAPAASDLPITMAISKAGDTVSYLLNNTTSKSESVTVTAADGTVSSVQQDVQTPYVAMLHVHLPASLTEVVAAGASVVTNSDGTHDLTWSMVLFAPIGSPTQTVAYTAKGSGSPVATLESQAVNPNGTPGLSATGATANATLAGNGTLGALAAGANTGLDQLAAGVGKIIAGLEKLASGANALHTGLGAGADGTNQLAAGLHTAKTGSGQLSGGLGQISAGTGQLAPGAAALKVGTGKLLAGLNTAAAGSDQLVNGSQDLATGAGFLSAGIGAILAGMKALPATLANDPKFQLLKGTVTALQDAIGNSSDVPHLDTSGKLVEKTLLGGLNLIRYGLRHPGGPGDCAAALKKQNPDEIKVACGVGDIMDIVGTKLKGKATDATPGFVANLQNAYKDASCPAPPGANSFPIPGVVPPVDPYKAAFTPGTPCLDISTVAYGNLAVGGLLITTSIGGVGQLNDTPVTETLLGGLAAIKFGLNNPACVLTDPKNVKNPCGVKQVLTLVNGGIDQLVVGISTTFSGFLQSAYDGSVQVAAGAGQLSELGAVPISEGLHKLDAGQALADAGAGKLAAGASQLNAGALKAFVGSKALDAGLGKISAGEDKLAAGLPAAVTGSGQIADGANQLLAGNKAVGKGLSDVKGKATGLLASQLTTGTQNAQTQLAVLDATSARLNATGVATTTYVLSQAADGTTVKASGGGHLGRNIALAAGGALLLLAGLGAGFVSGRRRVTV